MQPKPAQAQPTFDVIVIGAGSMGSATAYHLAKEGRRVLLVEQFTVGHTRGSSHGGSRIIRYTHETISDASIMPATFALWRALEKESGQALLQMTGGLYMSAETDPWLHDTRKTLQALNFPYRELNAAEMRREYPQFRLPASMVTLYQAESGILAATRCVQTLAAQAVRHGAELREQTKVLAVTPTGAGVTVRLATHGGEEVVYAQQAVLTAGPWAKGFLDQIVAYPLPLQVTHQQVAYFAVEQPELYAVGRFPLFMYNVEPYLYGFPIFEKPGHVKIALELLDLVVDPDQPGVIDPLYLRQLLETVDQTMVGIKPEALQLETCRYTETPNRDFIIDRHPEYPQILIGAGFSGRGFKFAISVGRLLADLAGSAPGAYNSPFWLPKFAITRFAKPLSA